MHVSLQTKKLTLFFFLFFLVVIYNKLLLNHLWSCVLKLVSELRDFMTGRETQRDIANYSI